MLVLESELGGLQLRGDSVVKVPLLLVSSAWFQAVERHELIFDAIDEQFLARSENFSAFRYCALVVAWTVAWTKLSSDSLYLDLVFTEWPANWKGCVGSLLEGEDCVIQSHTYAE